MGRHSVAPDAAPEPEAPGATDDAARRPQHPLLDRLALAGAAAASTGAVMAWAGAALGAWLLGAVGTGVVVLVAALIAGSVPAPGRARRDSRPDGET